MNLLIKNVLVADRLSPYNGQKVHIYIKNGRIDKISNQEPDGSIADIVDAEGCIISQGWVDLGAHFKDPGYEWLESLDSLADAGTCGGYTHIIGLPNTNPVVQSKEGMAYFENFSRNSAISLHNLAAVTRDCKGDDFTDMMDLHLHGAVGFSDGSEVIQNSDIFLKTLLYIEPLKVPLVVKSKDRYLSMYGQMHEGITSTRLGLKGIPSAGEELMIMRNLKLLEYSGVKSDSPILHFSTISTKESVKLIKEAKEKGLPVSCDVAAHHIKYTDESLVDFDTNFKVYPPFRTSKDIDALLSGLETNVIDMIVSDHNAWDEEHKALEFTQAEFGAIGLQTTFSVSLEKLGLETTLEKMVYAPRDIFKLGYAPIKEGGAADFTIFNLNDEYIVDEGSLHSTAINTPFLGQKLKGKTKMICNNGILKDVK